jgi:capsular exopolysaccharide synthesis family protein
LENSSFSFNDFKNQNASEQSGFVIEYKRILYRVVRYWYIIVLSFLAGLTIAYLFNRYTTRIYPVTSSIIIRESQERADAKFLYNNPLANPYRNFFNERYMMKSFPLVEKVVHDLNFHVLIQKEGNFKTKEQYKLLPIDLKVQSKEITSSTFVLELIDESTFRCYSDAENLSSGTVARYGETIDCAGNEFIVTKNGSLERFHGARYNVRILPLEVVTQAYINKLDVNWAEQGASVVNLAISGPIPQKETDFLDQLVENYQQSDMDKKNQAATRSIEFIDAQLKLIGDSLAFFEWQLQDFKKKNIVTDLSAESLRLYEQLQLLEQQKVKLITATNYYSYLEDYLRSESSQDKVILPSSIGISDGILNELVTGLITSQSELNALPPKRKLENPVVASRAVQLNQKVAELKNQIVESVKNQRATDKIQNQDLNGRIAKLEGRLQTLPVAERKLVNIRRNYSLNENLFVFLEQKRAEAGISKASNTSDITVVNPPRAGGATTPKIAQNYVVFGGIGLILPLLIFLAIELLNNKVQSREDIERMTSVPFIGGIGHKQSESNLIVNEKPKSALAESFRALRSNLNYFTEGKDKKVFMITSSLSGEGKTFTSINLACVFALSGKKTIIIGADLRKPKIYSDFGLHNDRGLSTYLSGLNSLEEVIQFTGIENLSLISGGPVPPNPSELILTQRMEALLELLKKDYDFILLDTPPMALITDGFVLSKFVDHTLYVIRQDYTPRSMLRITDEFYREGKFKNISLVLNDIRKTGPGYGYGYYGYGYYNYGYGYGYYGQQKKNQGYYSED